VGVVKTGLRVGGVIARLDEPGTAKRRGPAQVGSIKILRAGSRRSKKDQRDQKGQSTEHLQADSNAAGRSVQLASTGFAFTLPLCRRGFHSILVESRNTAAAVLVS
jgi:hypothetical protein